jgi:hypothetical protein
MRLRTVAKGVAPLNGPYRIILGFESENHWQNWIASRDHEERAWPAIEKTLRPNGLTAILYTLT